jgi:hypothetical protein
MEEYAMYYEATHTVQDICVTQSNGTEWAAES